MLRAVGGGGRSCGFLGLPLVVVELGCWWWILGLPLVVVEMGFGVVGFKEQKRKGMWVATIILCSVSGWVHHFGKKWS